MTREEAIERIKTRFDKWALDNEDMKAIQTLIPELRESEDEKNKNKSGYYKAGKFWKASTLWKAVNGKSPQKVPNRYILQECTWNISSLQHFADEVKNVKEVNLDYPIILDMNGNILDGAHRVVKAYLEDKDIDIVYLGDDEWPEPDYDEEKAVKESEDERIRKFLIDILSHGTWRKEWPFGPNEVVAWLEKQKEQKPVEKNLDEFVEFFTKRAKGYEINLPNRHYDIYAFCKDLYSFVPKQKPAEWSEKDEKMRENLLYLMLENNSQDSWEGTYEWLKSLHPSWKPDNEKHDYITPHKKFFQWIYDRLVYVHGENPDVDYMRSLKDRIEEMAEEQKPAFWCGDGIVAKMKRRCIIEKEKEQKPAEYIKRNSKEWNALLAEQYDKGFWKGKAEQKPVEWSESFEENIRILLHDKLAWHSEDGSMSSAVLIDDKTLKDIINGIWFYVGKEALKYPNKKLNVSEWSEEDEAKITFLERLIRYNVPEGQYGWTDGHKGGFITKLEAIAMLKSFRPSWKPSEEQMDRLFSIVAALRKDYCDDMADFLASLYKQLKAL